MRRPVQILQHTAIVLAGMGSIGLTVIAGTYIVNQMADATQHPGHLTTPGTALPEAAPPNSAPHESPETLVTNGTWDLAAETRTLPTAFLTHPPAAPEPLAHHPTPTAPTPTEFGARLQLPGDAYVGANLTTTQSNSLSMTLDTNLVTLLTNTDQHTALRTELNTRSGEVTVAVSGPWSANTTSNSAATPNQPPPPHSPPPTPSAQPPPSDPHPPASLTLGGSMRKSGTTTGNGRAARTTTALSERRPNDHRIVARYNRAAKATIALQ
ncbi:hypothetical protein [Nocardia terpenica]|uniref:Uncharacterized protein n=1 Tax=Nocardia terpenica TaxID=455432 RepID=A0A6G9ZDY6_9NOCA|nr:hypothetical protein [Nocardia terpenica]QIS23825.1 hypothetical protein F6W96_41605 [Nocardia terpenica]